MMAEGHNDTKEPSSRRSVSVRLKRVSNQSGPLLANLTSISIAQGLGHVEFGFVEPEMLNAIARHAQSDKSLPNGIDGVLTTRVALPFETLIRLHQQLDRILAKLHPRHRTVS
jgi:hypothetical protein